MPPATAAGQRALSTLANKLHPQLPLTPRESQQLLSLLTASFRRHLDREHPVHTAEVAHLHSTVPKAARHDPGTTTSTSSAALASQHRAWAVGALTARATVAGRDVTGPLPPRSR